jgi:REP element-mobilizing transposase RayT
LFGEIEKGRAILNDAGRMINCWWNELKNKYTNIEIDECVIMPNHCHGIINIIDPIPVRADEMGEHTGSPLQSVGADRCVCPSISTMVQWFKTMTTNEYICNVKQNHWEPFVGKLWQRNYYEQIIRDETSLRCIREYIVNNPLQWPNDKLFTP